MPYLKQSLPENQPSTVTIIERLPKSEGQWGPKFPYKIMWNGTLYDHDATLSEEKGLQKIPVGQDGSVEKKLNSYGKHSLLWNPGPAAVQRTMKQDEEWKGAQEEKGIAISLQGFMQQIIPVLIASGKAESVVDAALVIAVEARKACLKAAKNIHLGLPLDDDSADSLAEKASGLPF